MGTALSSFDDDDDDAHKQTEMLPHSLHGWPLEKVAKMNDRFRVSGMGFAVSVSEVAVWTNISDEDAQLACISLSRNPAKRSVNLMTILAVRSGV
jgi:hypothetical protein